MGDGTTRVQTGSKAGGRAYCYSRTHAVPGRACPFRNTR